MLLWVEAAAVAGGACPSSFSSSNQPLLQKTTKTFSPWLHHHHHLLAGSGRHKLFVWQLSQGMADHPFSSTPSDTRHRQGPLLYPLSQLMPVAFCQRQQRQLQQQREGQP
jgi:hypothetical protein